MISKPYLYMLDENGEPHAVENDVQQIVLAMQERLRRKQFRLAETTVGGAWVSTVFLHVDHQFGDGPPVLWETMVFCDDVDDELHEHQERYTSKEDAIEGHKRIVEMVRAHLVHKGLIKREFRRGGPHVRRGG